MVTSRSRADLPSSSADSEGVVSWTVESCQVPTQRKEETVSPAVAEGGRTEVTRWGEGSGQTGGCSAAL